MLKIKVCYKDENNETNWEEIRHLKPRRYMCGYTFDQILKYAKEELYWLDINENDIYGFEIYSDKEHWIQPIYKNSK